MSGGEQQMLAMGRALMAQPAAAPARRAVARPGAGDRRQDLRDHPRDQRAGHDDPARRAERELRARRLDRGYVLETGTVALSDSSDEPADRRPRPGRLPGSVRQAMLILAADLGAKALLPAATLAGLGDRRQRAVQAQGLRGEGRAWAPGCCSASSGRSSGSSSRPRPTRAGSSAGRTRRPCRRPPTPPKSASRRCAALAARRRPPGARRPARGARHVRAWAHGRRGQPGAPRQVAVGRAAAQDPRAGGPGREGRPRRGQRAADASPAGTCARATGSTSRRARWRARSSCAGPRRGGCRRPRRCCSTTRPRRASPARERHAAERRLAPDPRAEPGGRPTKRDRRRLERFRP